MSMAERCADARRRWQAVQRVHAAGPHPESVLAQLQRLAARAALDLALLERDLDILGR